MYCSMIFVRSILHFQKSRNMKKQLIFTIAKYLLALMMIVFGANKFIGFANVPPPPDETAQLFLGAMFSSYLAKLVGLTEIVGGILLLVPRTVFIGLLLLLPVVANIVGFHLVHDMPGNGLWLIPSLATLLLLIGFRGKWMDLLLD